MRIHDGYFALFGIASRNDSSLISWLENSLGIRKSL